MSEAHPNHIANAGLPTGDEPDPRIKRDTPVIEPQHAPGTIHSFTQLLGFAENGQLHADLTTELVGLVSRLIDHNRANGGKSKGAIALTMNFMVEKGQVDLGCDVKITDPKQVRERSTLWTGPNKKLIARNPHQRDFFLDANAGANRQVT